MKINLAVFFGGASVEHEISVISAVQAMHALDAGKYNILPVYMPKAGGFATGEKLRDIESFKDIPALLAACQTVHIARVNGQALMFPIKKGAIQKKPLCGIDMAFPIVHGTNTEDGTMQGFFELLGLPYVGCDVLASAAGMDKTVSKALWAAAGIPVLHGLSFTARQWAEEKSALTDRIAREIGFPLVVKPANLGSSVGITLVREQALLEAAVTEAAGFAAKILVEPAVTDLREINCAVLGDADQNEASPCEEPLMQDEILSYADKYMSSGNTKGMESTRRRLPADLPEETANAIRQTARQAFAAIGAAGVARVDFLLDAAQNKFYVNEINTIPGSLAFYLWAAADLSYDKLLDRLVELAYKRQRQRQNLTFSFDTNILSTNVLGGKNSKGGKR